MSSNRIYRVTEEGKEGCRLVRATSQAQAIRHVASTRFEAAVATQDDLVAALTNGSKVEEAGIDPADLLKDVDGK